MDGMTYEMGAVPSKKVSKKVATKYTKKIALQEFDRVSTGTILSMLAKRHKYGIIVTLFWGENILLVLHFFGVV
jgi:hypothetical protein